MYKIRTQNDTTKNDEKYEEQNTLKRGKTKRKDTGTTASKKTPQTQKK